MSAASSLLYPRLRGLLNQARRLDRRGRGKVIGASAFVAAVWIGLYYGLQRLLGVLYRVELLGPYLVDRLLLLLLVSFMGILLLSNIVTSLATYYLSAELMLVNAAPVSRLRLFYAKFFENLAASSWMVVVFGVPVILAYGTVHDSPIGFYALAAVTWLGFLFIPAAVSVVVTTSLVNIFPARAARDLFIIVTAFFLGGAWILFRMLRPERLANPEGFVGVAQFLGSLAVPQSSWLPSTWVGAALTPAMRGQVTAGLPAAGFVLLWAAAFTVLAAWITSALYLGGWSRAQEGRPARLHGLRGRRLQEWASRLLGRAGGAVMAKDAKMLVRDATQWSQLVLLLALVAIYLFSIHALPFEVLQFDTSTYRNAVAFLNVGMTGFVQSAVAARFVFPSISAEGRGIWILRASPTSAAELVRAKWIAGALPVLVFGEVLAVASNLLLRTDPLIMGIAILDAALAAFAICALAAGIGAAMPDFKAENAAKVAASFGGLLFMASALVVLFVLVALQAYPTWRLLMALQYHLPPARSVWIAGALGYGGSLVVAALVCLFASKRGALALEEREY
ncbi:MAG: hypothetical protein JXR83_02775 [Deltaproteobacteria bacterium]|nr:hypothetical protein [Deltaproteobacteria bacterium]